MELTTTHPPTIKALQTTKITKLGSIELKPYHEQKNVNGATIRPIKGGKGAYGTQGLTHVLGRQGKLM